MQPSKTHILKLSLLHPYICALHRLRLGRSGFFVRAGKLMLMLSGLLIVGCGGTTVQPTQPTPEIIIVYACSKYCPGPDSIYRKRVYRDIYDEKECLALGGEPYTFGTNWVCVVK